MTQSTLWPRAILLVDMNAFFAAVEQRDNPSYQNKPVVVTNGKTGSCIITCSYEARRFGIKTGTRMKEARQLCPELIHCPSRPKRYAEVSRQIMQALAQTISPDLEIYSVDEAFIDVTRCQRLHGTPLAIAELTKQTVLEASGLACSVGISGDKTTAKYAADSHKPNGLCIIPPCEARATLAPVPVEKIWGINVGIGRFLAQYGAKTCGDVAELPVSILAKRFGNVGRRLWYKCQGMDPEPVCTETAAPKSMGHGKIMPPNTKSKAVILTYFLHMCEKLAARLRTHRLEAQIYFIGLKTPLGWLGGHYKTTIPKADAQEIFAFCKTLLQEGWEQHGANQVQVTALDPKPAYHQPDLFEQPDTRTQRTHDIMDGINARFGEFTLAPARLLNRTEAPNVIAPAWRPGGPRQSI